MGDVAITSGKMGTSYLYVLCILYQLDGFCISPGLWGSR